MAGEERLSREAGKRMLFLADGDADAVAAPPEGVLLQPEDAIEIAGARLVFRGPAPGTLQSSRPAPPARTNGVT
jgi:hypothetical protein